MNPVGKKPSFCKYIVDHLRLVWIGTTVLSITDGCEWMCSAAIAFHYTRNILVSPNQLSRTSDILHEVCEFLHKVNAVAGRVCSFHYSNEGEKLWRTENTIPSNCTFVELVHRRTNTWSNLIEPQAKFKPLPYGLPCLPCYNYCICCLQGVKKRSGTYVCFVYFRLWRWEKKNRKELLNCHLLFWSVTSSYTLKSCPSE